MTDRLNINVDLPPYPAVVVAWTKRAAEAAEKANAFYKFADYFSGRAVFDCRTREGKFYDAPLRQKLAFGTVVEREKGFLTHTDEDHWITPFSMSVPLDRGTRFIVPQDTYRLDGHYLETDPAELAYEAVTDSVGIKTASCAYLVKDHQGPEAVAFFFPFTKWVGDVYLLVVKNTRYNSENYYLFDGNPEDYARKRKRNKRYFGEAEKDFYQVPLPEDYPDLKHLGSCMNALLTDGWLYNGYQDVETLKS